MQDVLVYLLLPVSESVPWMGGDNNAQADWPLHFNTNEEAHFVGAEMCLSRAGLCQSSYLHCRATMLSMEFLANGHLSRSERYV
jgi:hypothetical protein